MSSFASLQRKVVLVVEDDADARAIFRDAIRAAGFTVVDVSDGLEALRIIEASPPALVVLDVRLPMLDGISVREEIAANAATRDLPVIIVTAFDIDRRRVHNARIMRKPLTPEELVGAVRSALSDRRTPA
jgi:DNA-binding response OmpR family regulator